MTEPCDLAEIGTTVREIGDSHIGRIAAIDHKREQYLIQWHKGYATWVSFDRTIEED